MWMAAGPPPCSPLSGGFSEPDELGSTRQQVHFSQTARKLGVRRQCPAPVTAEKGPS